MRPMPSELNPIILDVLRQHAVRQKSKAFLSWRSSTFTHSSRYRTSARRFLGAYSSDSALMPRTARRCVVPVRGKVWSGGG